MEPINCQPLLLSNFEVYDILREEDQSASKGKKSSRKATIAYETEQYLKSFTSATVTSAEVVSLFLNAFQKYRLTKGEKLQILNHRPTSLVELQLLVEESEERFSEEIMNEMVELVAEIIPEPSFDDATRPGYSRFLTDELRYKMFSVDQVHWVKQLRDSGLTRDRVFEIWNRLDQLEAEEKARRHFQMVQNSVPMSSPDGNAIRCQNSASIPLQTISNHHSQFTESSQSSKDSSDFSNGVPTQSSSYSRIMGTEPSTDARFLEYKSRPEPEVVEEIKNFVLIHNIKQQKVADMSGISQGYISKFFRGEGSEMSERSKNLIIMWYLLYKDCPEKIFEATITSREVALPPRPTQNLIRNEIPSVRLNPSLTLTPVAISSEMAMSPSRELAVTRVQPSFSNQLMPQLLPNHQHSININIQPSPYVPGSQRRQRFIFRTQQLAILMRHFQYNPYPDQYAKEQIVDEMNSVVEQSSGRPLGEKDKVTSSVVSNWFNNRRKEKKSFCPSSSDTPRRGRPPRPPNCPSADGSQSPDQGGEEMKHLPERCIADGGVVSRPESPNPNESEMIIGGMPDFDGMDDESSISLSNIKVEKDSNGYEVSGGHEVFDEMNVFGCEVNEAENGRFMNRPPNMASQHAFIDSSVHEPE